MLLSHLKQETRLVTAPGLLGAPFLKRQDYNKVKEVFYHSHCVSADSSTCSHTSRLYSGLCTLQTFGPNPDFLQVICFAWPVFRKEEKIAHLNYKWNLKKEKVSCVLFSVSNPLSFVSHLSVLVKLSGIIYKTGLIIQIKTLEWLFM